MSLRRLPALGLALLVLSHSGEAFADLQGATGQIIALRINNSASDEYPSFKGEVHIGDAIGGVVSYSWGGSLCPVVSFSDGEVAALQRGFNNPRIVVQPFYKPGMGGANCLVGFRLILRSEQALFP